MVSGSQEPFSPKWRWFGSPPRQEWGMGNRIRELRKAIGLTQEEVAETVGTSPQQIARLERSQRRLSEDWMRRIAPALGVSLAALLSDEAPDIAKIVQEPKKVRLFPDEVLLIKWWRGLDLAEKRWIAILARDKGLEILSDNSEQRRA